MLDVGTAQSTVCTIITFGILVVNFHFILVTFETFTFDIRDILYEYTTTVSPIAVSKT